MATRSWQDRARAATESPGNSSTSSTSDTPPSPTSRARTMPGLMLAHGQHQTQLEAEIERLKEELAKRPMGSTAPLARFHKVPGRQRSLQESEKEELRNNMRSLGRLITPITVEIRDDGDFDVIAGNNRLDAATEIGWEEIEYHVFSGTKQQASASAFYSNLLHPSLPDFEKYLGFKKLILETGMTQAELAKESGLSKVVIGRFLAFDKLPQEAIELIDQNKSAIGSSLANSLAQLAEAGRNDDVVAVVKDVIQNGMSQTAALEKATKPKTNSKSAKPQAEEVNIRQGNAIFAKLKGTGTSLRVDFKDENLRKEFMDLFAEFIKSRINN